MRTEPKRTVIAALELLTDDEMNEVDNLIQEVRNRRLKQTLIPGDRVVTLEAGFGGWAGVKCYFLGFVKKGDPSDGGNVWGGDYATFGPTKDGESRWLLTMDELDRVKKI